MSFFVRYMDLTRHVVLIFPLQIDGFSKSSIEHNPPIAR